MSQTPDFAFQFILVFFALFRFLIDLVFFIGFDVGNLGEDGIELLAAGAGCTLLQIILRIESGYLLGNGKGDQLIDRRMLALGKQP